MSWKKLIQTFGFLFFISNFVSIHSWASAPSACLKDLVRGPSELAEHLLLTEDQMRDLIGLIEVLKTSGKLEAVIFTGSRTHKLWRSGFDIDLALVGPRPLNIPEEFDRLREEFRIIYGINIDVVRAFQIKNSLRGLIDGGFLIDAVVERQLIERSVDIWNRIAQAQRITHELRLKGLMNEYLRAATDLQKWVNEPLLDLPNQKALKLIDHHRGPLAFDLVSVEGDWRPLGPKSGNEIFYRVAAGLGAFRERGRTFHLSNIGILFLDSNVQVANELSSMGFSHLYTLETPNR